MLLLLTGCVLTALFKNIEVLKKNRYLEFIKVEKHNLEIEVSHFVN